MTKRSTMTATSTLPPGFTIRGHAVLAIIDPDHWADRPALDPGPQDDADDPAVSLGFRLYVYVAGLICATVGLLVLVGTAGLNTLSESEAFASFGLAVLWAVSFSGIMDYAIRGARR